MPTPTDHLKRAAVLGNIDSSTGLPSWAVDDSEAVKSAGIAALDLFTALDKLEQQVARIGGDDDLTADGRQRRIAATAGTFVKVEVALAEGKLQGLERTLRHARAEVMIPAPEGNEVVVAMRAAEIREQLRGLGGIELVEAALVAAQRGDAEVLHALQDAPGAPLLDEGNWAKIREAYFAEAKPDEMARVERLESAHRQFSGQIKAAKRRAAQLGAPNTMQMTAA